MLHFFSKTEESIAISEIPEKISIIRIILILMISFSSRCLVLCQDIKLSEVIVTIAEELADDESDPEALNLYIERMTDLAEDPVIINSNDLSELSRLFFLSDFQIKALADYTSSSGLILSIYEIASIPGFDRETAMMMIPFISMESMTRSNYDSAYFRSILLTNISVRSTDIDTAAPGSPVKLLTKYRFTSGNITGGFTAEKDQGEKLLNGRPPLPDFFSAHLSYSGNGFIRKIVIGDFSVRFGQGTNINSGLRTGFSLTSPGNISGKDEIKPYTSTDENNFFRGLATQFQVKNINLFVHYSLNNIDGALNSTNGISNDYIENLNSTGLHNTQTLLMKKDNISITSYGWNLLYNFSNLKLGFTWAHNSLSLPLILPFKKPGDLFDFEGNTNTVSSVYYTGLIKKMIVSGEISYDHRRNFTLVQAFTLRPADRLTLNVLYRNYAPGFTAFHGNGTGSSSSGDNLHALLGAFSFEAAKYLFISAGWDMQYFPWIRYKCSGPSVAQKGEIRIKYIPSDQISSESVYSYRYSMYDEQERIGIKRLEHLITREFKSSLRYSPFTGLTFTTRVGLKFIEPSGSNGMMMMQDVNYKFIGFPVSIWFRYCVFNTDDWNSRLYTWENDLLYSFSIPALSGVGTRSYLLAAWKIIENAEFRIKYGIITLTGDKESIEGIQELKLQFRVRF